MIGNLINQVQMLIDKIFLGQSKEGIESITAIGNAGNLLWTTMAIVFSLSIGSSILISQSVGEGNKNRALEFAGAFLKFHNIIPVILFFFWMFCSPFVFDAMGVTGEIKQHCITYTVFYSPVFLTTGIAASLIVILQTSNYTKHLVTYGIIRSSVNVILDYILIFGKLGFPEMGIQGAAIATTIAEYCGIGFGLLIFIKSKKLSTKPDWTSIKNARFSSYLKSLKLGINASLEEFSWNLGNLGITRILNHIDPTAAGIWAIVFSFEILAVVIIGALGNGTLTLSSEATGAKDLKLFRSVTGTSYLWAAIVSAFTLLLTWLIPDKLLSLFTNDPAVIKNSSIFLLLIGFNLFGKSGNIIVGSGIRGYGDTKWMFFTQIFGTIFVLGTACLFVFVFDLGMTGVYLAVICDEIVRAIINTCKFTRIKF